MKRAILGLAVLALAGCQQPNMMQPLPVAQSNYTQQPVSPIASYKVTKAKDVDIYRGFFDGGTAQLGITPEGRGMSNYFLTGSGDGCSFAAEGKGPTNARKISLTSQAGGRIPVTLTRKGKGWAFQANSDFNPARCTFQGEVMP